MLMSLPFLLYHSKSKGIEKKTKDSKKEATLLFIANYGFRKYVIIWQLGNFLQNLVNIFCTSEILDTTHLTSFFDNTISI